MLAEPAKRHHLLPLEKERGSQPERKPMKQKHHNSIADNEEVIEAPAPRQIGHRKKFETFEQNITGGHHIGHLPVYVLAIEGWTFRRCRCGFSLALTSSGAIWWLRTTKDAMEIKSFKLLLRALNSNCWAHPRPEPLKNMNISAPAVTEIAAETSVPAAAEGAISSAVPPASLETQSQSQAKDNPAVAPQVEKPPAAKRRRTYVPGDARRKTHSQPNPAGR
jgi:hypothetical protein